jgi:hypothetical protein
MKSKKYLKLVIIVILLIGMAYVFVFTYGFIYQYFGVNVGSSKAIDGFNDAEQFVKYGYPEIKTLSTQMLTLLTSVLVFSITFSEKILNFSAANPYTKKLLMTCWFCILLAIICDGIGLAFNSFALPFALSDIFTIHNDKINSIEFYEPAFKSLTAIIFGGIFFILGLVLLIFAGITGLKKAS